MKTEPPLYICLATHQAPAGLWRRQLASLRRQTLRHWVCLVQDDASDAAHWRALRASLKGDRRFMLRRNRKRLGSFLNFEACLRRVPRSAEIVAFCDQDDRWYPQKLARSVEALRSQGALLAYSDMRVVDAHGRVLAPTYWHTRRNQWWDLSAMVLANTVSGAASVFRRSLLDRALPFPRGIAQMEHDAWLALVALCQGTLANIPEALYDYVQHGGNTLGFAGELKRRSRIRRLLGGVARALHPAHSRAELTRAQNLAEVHRPRMGQIARALQTRLPAGRLRSGVAEELARLVAASHSRRALFTLSLRRHFARADSVDMEHRLLYAEARMALGRRRC